MEVTLLPIFRTDSQARLLAHLFLGREPMSLSELSAATEIPLATVHREVDRLEAAGLLVSERIGNVRRVRADDDSPYHPDLRSLLLKAFGPVPVLRRVLAPVRGIKEAHVVGSFARRELGEPGPAPADIDVVVVGDPDLDEVYAACRTAERELDIPVNPTPVSPMEWREASSGFLRAIREGPRLSLLDRR